MAQTDQQLKRAVQLVKTGNRQEAGRTVRDVLRVDKTNVDAWWMIANLLEDDYKALKCAEKVLQLKPDHQGAQKKVAELRQRLGQSGATAALDADTNIHETLMNYDWSKLRDDPANPTISRRTEKQETRIATIALVIIGLFSLALIAAVFYLGASPDPPPEDVARVFFVAVGQFNSGIVAERTCDRYREDNRAALRTLQARVDDELRDQFGQDSDALGLRVEASDLTFEVIDRGIRRATVRATGDYEFYIGDFAQTFSVSDSDLPPEMTLIVEGNQWVYCDPLLSEQ